MQYSNKSTLPGLVFLRAMKAYECIDKSTTKAALQKFCQHLWHLTDEVAVLSLFDDEVGDGTKVKEVTNLTKATPSAYSKRYISSKEELCGSLYGQSHK